MAVWVPGKTQIAVDQRTLAAVGVPRFDLPPSGLTWQSTAQPQKYFDATGRRAAIFGKQDGRLEAWIYPIKLLHGFHVEFRQEGMLEPVRGEECVLQVIARPESTTLVYVHPLFTVRQIIWIPQNEPAAVMFFDIDSDKPITVTAKFSPDFKPMWPASLGGQYSFWMDDDHAFGLTDSTGLPTAMIGSPAVTAYTQYVDVALMNGEMALQFRVTKEQARAQFLPLIMTLSMQGSSQAREVYRNMLGHARELYEQRVSYYRDYLARTMEIETPDPELNRAFTWAKVAIDAGWVCSPVYGCGLIAGYGPSGNGERPGFDWWFGGDALMSTWALEDYGDYPGALQALRFLKGRQRSDGKMLHEMTQSVGLIDWFGKYPYAYYHADTTPFYLYSIEQYWSRTGDRKFLDEFWDSAKHAYEYCITTVDPNDGLMDNTKAGLAAVEGGVLRGRVAKDSYLEGAWLAGLEATEELARSGDSQLAADAQARLQKARETLEMQWWNPQGDFFAFGQTVDGRRDDMVSAWSSVLLALSSQIPADKATGDIAKLASPELATDWALRTISDQSPFYDPVSYNNGTAWPFLNIFVSWAEYERGNPIAGFKTWRDGARLTGMQSPGYMPEHMNGDRYLPGERSVPHQLFSSVGVVVPAVRGLLGLETSGGSPRAASSSEIGLRLHPQLPANWNSMRFSRYVIGDARLSGEVRQGNGKTTVRLHLDGSHAIGVDLVAPIPLFALVRRVLVNGEPVRFVHKQLGGANGVNVQFTLKQDAEVTVGYDGGVAIVPPTAGPSPGDRNTSLKILRVTAVHEKTLEIAVAGVQRDNVLDLMTALPKLTSEDAQLQKTATGYRLTIPFEGSEYQTRVIRVTVPE